MSRTRLLFVESYPHVLFGQQHTLLSLLDAAQDLAIEPVVGVTVEGVFCDEVRARGLELVAFPYPELLGAYGGAVYRYRGLKRVRMIGQGMGYLLDIRRHLHQLNLDGVFCNDMRGLLTVGLAARTLGLPVLIWDKLDKPHGWLDWLQLPLVTTNVIISQAVTRKYPAWQRAWLRHKIVPVSEGAELDRFDAAESIRATLPAAEDDILLAIIGSITHRKGHDRLFAIWPQLIQFLPNLRLLVIGEPSGNIEDARYASQLPNRDHPRINFLGMRNDVPNLMKSIDILLVPSRHEGMGLVIVEAMATGKPVIGARTGGIPEVVVDGETGLLFDGDDASQLMSAIERLSLSAELRARMGAAGRRRVEQHFNRPVQMQRVLQLCLDMLKPKPRSHRDD